MSHQDISTYGIIPFELVGLAKKKESKKNDQPILDKNEQNHVVQVKQDSHQIVATKLVQSTDHDNIIEIKKTVTTEQQSNHTSFQQNKMVPSQVVIHNQYQNTPKTQIFHDDLIKNQTIQTKLDSNNINDKGIGTIIEIKPSQKNKIQNNPDKLYNSSHHNSSHHHSSHKNDHTNHYSSNQNPYINHNSNHQFNNHNQVYNNSQNHPQIPIQTSSFQNSNQESFNNLNYNQNYNNNHNQNYNNKSYNQDFNNHNNAFNNPDFNNQTFNNNQSLYNHIPNQNQGYNNQPSYNNWSNNSNNSFNQTGSYSQQMNNIGYNANNMNNTGFNNQFMNNQGYNNSQNFIHGTNYQGFNTQSNPPIYSNNHHNQSNFNHTINQGQNHVNQGFNNFNQNIHNTYTHAPTNNQGMCSSTPGFMIGFNNPSQFLPNQSMHMTHSHVQIPNPLMVASSIIIKEGHHHHGEVIKEKIIFDPFTGKETIIIQQQRY